MKEIVKSTSNVQKKKRRKRRRGNMIIYYIMILLLALAAFAILSLTVFFNVDEFKISGSDIYSNEEILEIAGVKKGDNLYRMDLDEIEEKIMKKLVYVDDVLVKRALPSTLVIEITQAFSVANIEYNGKYYAISMTGKVLKINEDEPLEKLPTIIGGDVNEPVLGEVIEFSDTLKRKILSDILESIENNEFEKITEIDITNRGRIYLNFDGRIKISIGSSQDIDRKLSEIKGTIERLNPTFEGEIIYNSTTAGISVLQKEEGENSDSN